MWLVPSVAWAQAIGRWGNFFNSERLLALPTNGPLETLDSGINRPAPFIRLRASSPHLLYESFWKPGCFWPCLLILFRLGERARISLPEWCPQLQPI